MEINITGFADFCIKNNYKINILIFICLLLIGIGSLYISIKTKDILNTIISIIIILMNILILLFLTKIIVFV